MGREVVNIPQCFSRAFFSSWTSCDATRLLYLSTFCAVSVLLWVLCSGQCGPDAEGGGPALPCPELVLSTPLFHGLLHFQAFWEKSCAFWEKS